MLLDLRLGDTHTLNTNQCYKCLALSNSLFLDSVFDTSMWRDPSRVKTFSPGSNWYGTTLANIPVFLSMPLVLWFLSSKHDGPLPEWVFNFETISLYRNDQSNLQSFPSFSASYIGFLFCFVLHAFVCLFVCCSVTIVPVIDVFWNPGHQKTRN